MAASDELHDHRRQEELQERVRREAIEHRMRREELEKQLREESAAADSAAYQAFAAEFAAEADDALDWLDDPPAADELTTQQKAILACFERLKKKQEDAAALEAANEEEWRCKIDLSIEAQRRSSDEQAKVLLEDEATRRAFNTAERRARCRAHYEKYGYNGAGPPNAPVDAQ